MDTQAFAAHLDMQPDITDLERRALPHVNAHKVGGILVEDVDLSQAVEEKLPADRARESGEEGHGLGEAGGGVAGLVDWRHPERLSLGAKGLHKWSTAVLESPSRECGAPVALPPSVRTAALSCACQVSVLSRPWYLWRREVQSSCVKTQKKISAV